MVLELDDKEKETLKHALRVFGDDLKNERVRTDNHEWKTAIHDEESTLRGILCKIA